MNSKTLALRHAPLWPAGHLPHTGGDWAAPATRLISPRVGEMAGRPEGGAVERSVSLWEFGRTPR
jgi:hypothetical protein